MQNSVLKNFFVTATSLLCIAGCATDIALLYIFGKQIPGYNHLTDSISSLGITGSPVSEVVTAWSVSLGGIFILFGIGLQKAFGGHGKISGWASWLIIIYALGEGVISGIFKADTINGELTRSALLHDILGGVGEVAVMLFPLVMMRIFKRESMPALFRYSKAVAATGLLTTLMFAFRVEYFRNTFLNTYSGLWQRAFLLNFYVYFTVIAFVIIIKSNNFSQIKAYKL